MRNSDAKKYFNSWRKYFLVWHFIELIFTISALFPCFSVFSLFKLMKLVFLLMHIYFLGYFHMQLLIGTMEKKDQQNFQEFSKKYMEQFVQFLHAKTATSPTEQFKRKIVFSPSSYSEKMRWGRGWPKQLCVLFIVKA